MASTDAFWDALRKEVFLIVGFSELTGVATARLFSRMGVPFKISDCATRELINSRLGGLRVRDVDVFAGPQQPTQLDGITHVMLSPGVPRSIPLVREAIKRGVPVWSDYDLLYPVYAKKQIAAVTGTDGKTTTTTLLGDLLKPSRRVVVAGNIGVPIASVYDEIIACDSIVLELSSFMLEDVKRFRANVSTVLNLAQDHVDRYSSMNEYESTKRNIVRHARESDIFVQNLDDPRIATWELPGIVVHTVSRYDVRADARIHTEAFDLFGARLSLNELTLHGAHLADDTLTATLMAVLLGVPAAQALAVAAKFPGVPHRFEMVGTFGGVDVIDDSKATSVQAVHRALESLIDRHVVLVVGGQDKHLDPSPLVRHDHHLRAVVGYGQAGQRLVNGFETVPTHYCSAFPDAIKLACTLTTTRDVLLLSPMCTSFDQHLDYRERGQVFRQVARTLLLARGEA